MFVARKVFRRDIPRKRFRVVPLLIYFSCDETNGERNNLPNTVQNFKRGSAFCSCFNASLIVQLQVLQGSYLVLSIVILPFCSIVNITMWF